MTEFYMAVAAAGRRAAYFKQVTKLLDTQIDQALVYVQTKDIDKPAVYDSTCLTLGSFIETAIAMKAVPSPSHLPKLLLIVKEVYIRKAGLPDSSLMTLLIHIKSACQAGWYTDEDKDCLLIMVDKATMGYYNLDNRNDEPTDAHSVSEIISRFYPRMRVEKILASFDVKAGEGKSVANFYIAPDTVPHQNLWLLVARTDNMETSACLTSPSNVDFLINDSEVPNRTRRKMGKGAQLPTNVTKMVKDGVNHLQVIGEFDGEYVIALAIMSLISSPDSSQLQDYVHPMSNDVDSDCFVTNGQSRILLDCPISGFNGSSDSIIPLFDSGRRIRTPVKGHLCTHSQILNEVADNVGDVYVSDDGSWTEKSQINRDAINQQNHVPVDTENLLSLEASETPTMSSLALHTIGGSAINMPVECPSTVEQSSVTTPAVSLEANETPPMSSSALHNIGGSVIQCPSTVEQLSVTTPAVSLEANETPHMSSSALHNVGGSVIQCPSTFEQPTVTMPAVSFEANETPLMSSALHNIGDFVIECPSTFEQPNVTTPPVLLEANGTPPMSSSDFHSIGDLAINMTVECPSTFEQANVTTPAVNPPQVVKDSLLMPQSSCEVVHTPPLVQQTRPDLNPTATQVPAQALCQNSPTLTNQPTEADNYNHAVQSSCDLVHTPPLTQQTRPNPNRTASHLPAQTQSQNSQTQTDQPTEADNGMCTGNQARSSNRVRRTTVFTPVLLTPPSAAPVLRKLERRPRSTTDQAQGTTLVTPAIKKRVRKRKITTIPAVGTEAQGTTLVTPIIKKRGRKPKIPTDPAVGLNVPQVSPTQVPEVTRDEMSSVRMRGILTGKDREAAQLEYLAPPIQPIYADKPWPEPTTTVPVELLMKEGNINHPRDLPQ
ncbi:E4 SUMO-protein ligase PIAL2 isoform X1 [Tanacetum coccineum]